MEGIELLKTRRSIRTFSGEEVSDSELRSIIDAAAYAPSWKNTQTVSYIAVRNKDTLEKIINEGVMGHAGNKRNIGGCAVLVAVITQKGICGYEADGKPTTSRGDKWETFDAGIATQTFCLAAHAYGVGSVIMGIYDEQKMAEILGIDNCKYAVSALIALGKHDGTAKAPKRKTCDELLTII